MKSFFITLTVILLSALAWFLFTNSNDSSKDNLVNTEIKSLDSSTDHTSTTVTGQIWADNWFALYSNGQLVAEDSVSINTERSFNAETFTFPAEGKTQLAFIVKDYKENNTGLEYIGTRKQQMGDGGFIAQFSHRGKVVGVSDDSVLCVTTHHAPIDKGCEKSTNPTQDCKFTESEEPVGWKDSDFDDSDWENAIVYSESAVSPKDGYDEIDWDNSAKLIWGDDLEQDNTLLCRMTLDLPTVENEAR